MHLVEINSKMEVFRSSVNSFLPTFISMVSVNILSLSHCNPSLAKNQFQELMILRQWIRHAFRNNEKGKYDF
jgi:hypothetical protein